MISVSSHWIFAEHPYATSGLTIVAIAFPWPFGPPQSQTAAIGDQQGCLSAALCRAAIRNISQISDSLRPGLSALSFSATQIARGCGALPPPGAALAGHVNDMGRFADITEPAIAALVARFYAKARRDPLIGPVFENAVDDWDEHLRTLNAFWSSVMLTSGRYKGNPMAAHLKLPIEPRFFEQWLALWHETAAELFAPNPAAQFAAKAERIAESLKLALFYRPAAMTRPRMPA
jgi:hemoglobin